MKLQDKLLAALLPIALISGALILWLASRSVDKVLLEGLADRGFIALNDAAAAAAPGIQAGEENTLLPILNAAHSQARAVYAMVLDASGKTLAHTNVLERGKIQQDEASREALNAAESFRTIQLEGKSVVDVSIPIWSHDDDFLISLEPEGRKRLGTLRLGLSMEDAARAKERILRRIAAILLASGFAALAAILLMLRGLLAPIGLLAAFANRIELGSYGATLPVRSSDELGDLTQSFNRMSAALAETTVSREHLDGVQRSILDLLIVTDIEGKIRSANVAALETLGYGREELNGRSALALFGLPETAGAGFAASPLENLAGPGFLVDAELELVGKNGGRIPVLMSGSALRNREGKTEGFVLAAKNLSERKKLEGMLLQSEKLSAVGQLAAGVAHEINNPLGIILGFAQSAARRIGDDDPLKLPIRSIEREALRCKNLVQNLLTFSRQGRAQMEGFDINAAVADALCIIEAQARVKSVEIARELGEIPAILGDRNQVQQILINLCGNAIDAMPNGGRIVIRTAVQTNRGKRWAHLSVEDNGSGIPADIQDKIFNPFFTTKEVGKGTGLGLPLVHEIVEKHGGTIEFDTKPGHGTKFTVSLPIRDAQNLHAERPQAELSS